MSLHRMNHRPVHLNLFRIRLPVPGVMSIIHRITGVLMFIGIPGMIYLLDHSLISPEGYAESVAFLHSGLGMLMLFGLMWSLMHHLLAGLRYLLIDVDLGVEREMARRTALAVIVLAPLFGLLLTWGLLQ
jgi:succinate dehydrogenase / fumarate reductase cytochrome b subunit